MQKQKKLSFFQKIFLAISDFRVYPYILKTEKLAKSFAHFIGFILLIVAAITIRYSSDVMRIIDDFINEYDKLVPEFSLTDGVLKIDNTDFVKIGTDMAAAINTDYKYDEYVTTEEYRQMTRYDARIFINSDSITYESYDGSGMSFLLTEVESDYDKNSFYEHITGIYTSTRGKIVIIFTVFISVAMAYGFTKVIELLLYAVLASLVAVLYRIKVDFKNYFKIAIYIVTLPYILETISIIYTGTLKDYALFASTLLAYVYIFYAIRAIKLDAFLILMNKKNKIVSNAENNEIDNVTVQNDTENEEEKNVENKEDSNENDSNGG